MATQCKGVFFSRYSSNGWEYSNEQNKVLALYRRKYDSKLSKYIGYVRLQQRNKKKKKKIYWLRNSWQSSVQDSTLSLQRAWVQSLVRELKSHRQLRATKKKKKERETKQNGYWLREMEIREGITVLFWVVKRSLLTHRYGYLTFVL